MTVEVLFPGIQGIPDNIEEIKKRIEQILPCHLEILYHYKYITWAELENWFSSWAELEAENLNWNALELSLIHISGRSNACKLFDRQWI